MLFYDACFVDLYLTIMLVFNNVITKNKTVTTPRRLLAFFCTCWLSNTSLVLAATDTLSLKELSLNELSALDVLVTSASKRPQKLSQTAAAMFVITQEDIRNSGVTTIPDALRMAPGIQVARIDVNKWSVTARGFSGRFANKLLVMIDGRTIYNPLFSGTHWDTYNAQMENIERIEIIRGPGAAMWGANAVNGVINIISKSAKKTQGTMISAAVGSETHQGFLRHAGKISDNMHFRVYGNYKYFDDSVNSSDADTADQLHLGQGGARLEWQMDNKNKVTVLGDYHRGEPGHNSQTVPLLSTPFSSTADQRFDFYGGNVNLHWVHLLSDDNIFDFNVYFDSVTRESATFSQSHHTLDIEGDHQFRIKQHAINWGIGYRVIFDHIFGNQELTLNPVKRNTQNFSFFVQDEITLLPNTLKTIFAIRIDHNDYSGFEYQPTARIFWTPIANHSVWAAFSRAVRTPARTTDIRIDQRVIPGTPPTLVSIFGHSEINSEEVFAYEAGYNFRFSEEVKLNFSAFYNEYDELRTFEQQTPSLVTSPSVHVLAPLVTDNKMQGETYGVEISGTWQPSKTFRLNAAYTYTKLNLHYKDNSVDTTAVNAEGETPQQQFSLRTDTQLSDRWDVNLWMRYVDSLPAQNIKAYITLDARLAWRPIENLEFSVVGQNLINDRQMEYSPEILNISGSKVERSVYGKVVLQF